MVKATKVLHALQLVRRANLRKLLAERFDGNQAAMSRKLEYAGRASLSLLVSGERPITERTARRVEEMLKLPPGWMDQKRKGDDK